MIFECILAARQANIIDRQRSLAADNRALRQRIEQLEKQMKAQSAAPAPKEPTP